MRFNLSAWMFFCILLVQLYFQPAYAQNRYCGAADLHHQLISSDPEYRLRFEDAQRIINSGNQYQKNSSSSDSIITIPVVVHVLYHDQEENISDEQIKSQIDVLNEDYSALNATVLDVPPVWQGLVHDSYLRFRLAVRDPLGNPTNGIERTYTNKISFPINSQDIYDDLTGGKDAWPNDSYLNIWVCALDGNALGFSAFPGSSPTIDGIVISHHALGRKGIVKSPYDGGRTSTHELGHWLNLRHIWGDDAGACDTTNDGIRDTPNQGDSHFRCQVFPSYDNCTSVFPGVMYMNYLDYTDDKCMMFFTPDQIAMMRNVFNNYRSPLKISDGCNYPFHFNKEMVIESVNNPAKLASDRCFVPEIRLSNRGVSIVSSIKLRYSVNGGLQKEYFTTINLPVDSSQNVQLPAISADLGNNIFEVWLDYPDSNSVNNYYSSSFKVNSATNSNCENSGLEIFPNPVSATTSVCIKTKFNQSQESKISIYNIIGQELFSEQLFLNPGDAFPISLRNLNAGVYLLRVDGSLFHETKKFIYLPDKNGVSGEAICN